MNSPEHGTVATRPLSPSQTWEPRRAGQPQAAAGNAVVARQIRAHTARREPPRIANSILGAATVRRLLHLSFVSRVCAMPGRIRLAVPAPTLARAAG